MSSGKALAGMLVTTILAGLVLLFIEYDGFKSQDNVVFVTVAAQSPSGQPEPSTVQSTPAPTGTVVQNTVPEEPVHQAPVFAPVAVALSDAVFEEWCRAGTNTGWSWQSAAPAIGGVPHPGGFRCEVRFKSMFGQVDFLVPAGATRFTATAGQLDSSFNVTLTIRFQVVDTVTGAVLASSDLAYGQAAEIDVPVTGVLRLSLKVNMLTYVTDPWETQGYAAWGDPTFR